MNNRLRLAAPLAEIIDYALPQSPPLLELSAVATISTLTPTKPACQRGLSRTTLYAAEAFPTTMKRPNSLPDDQTVDERFNGYQQRDNAAMKRTAGVMKYRQLVTPPPEPYLLEACITVINELIDDFSVDHISLETMCCSRATAGGKSQVGIAPIQNNAVISTVQLARSYQSSSWLRSSVRRVSQQRKPRKHKECHASTITAERHLPDWFLFCRCGRCLRYATRSNGVVRQSLWVHHVTSPRRRSWVSPFAEVHCSRRV